MLRPLQIYSPCFVRHFYFENLQLTMKYCIVNATIGNEYVCAQVHIVLVRLEKSDRHCCLHYWCLDLVASIMI